MGILTGLFRLLNRSKMKAFDGIPGPTPRFPLGTLPDFIGRQPWEVCADYGRRFGGLTLIWLFGKPALVLNDPALIGEVLDTHWQSFYKDAPGRALAPLITPDCLFIANGDHWAFMRANHPINRMDDPAWMARVLPRLRDQARDWIRRQAARGTPVDLIEACMRLCYDGYSLAVWGKTLGDANYSQFQTMARTGSARMNAPPLAALPPLRPKFYRDRGRWYATMEALVREARSNPDPHAEGLVYDVLRANPPFDERLLRLVLSAPIYFGGGFSMASGIVTTLYLLAKHPEQGERVRAEIRERVPDVAALDLAGLESCRLLDAALRETLRYLGPVPLYFRNVQKSGPARLGDRTVPADTVLFISNWYLHRSPAHWRDPERYDLSRWEGAGTEENPPGSGYFFPFGRGPRACIGQPYALFYMKLVLAAVLSSGRVELEASRPLRHRFFFGVLMPRGLLGRLAC